MYAALRVASHVDYRLVLYFYCAVDRQINGAVTADIRQQCGVFQRPGSMLCGARGHSTGRSAALHLTTTARLHRRMLCIFIHSSTYSIDVINVFLLFYSGHRFTFFNVFLFFFPRFFI